MMTPEHIAAMEWIDRAVAFLGMYHLWELTTAEREVAAGLLRDAPK